jgi:hypothetical protein
MYVSVLVYSGTVILYVDLTDTFYSLKKTPIFDTCGMIEANYQPSIQPRISIEESTSSYALLLQAVKISPQFT